MKLQRVVLGLLVAGLGACSDAPTAPEQFDGAPQMVRHEPTTLLTDVTGLLTGGTFTGTAQITDFAVENGELVTSGVLNGVATIGGITTQIVNQAFTTTTDLTSNTNSCDILLLDLGPIFLDVLGLQVDLSQVVLDIDAVSGSGNLLGNLLCAVTHLLDNPLGNLSGLLNLLDRINDLLG